ncbi:hypothetical protein SO802_026115 [Lithocarpus litseifolius]|uniref:Protein FAR1-RELATED SEQUENCE n=1 Tax=Lithocarpus litseifolius TaxID=425828 RepID=A0AAW2BYK7_9ROSI
MLGEEVLDMLRGKHFVVQNKVNRLLTNVVNSAMSRKQPRTIFTNQSAAMANAKEDVSPGSNHHLCVWHIYQNAAKRLHRVFNTLSQFQNDLSNCVYDFEDEDEWIVAWNNMPETYDLTDNPWLHEMFDVKEKWSMVYGRHMFTTDIKSTQCSELMNSVLKTYLKPKHGLLQFFGHYSRELSDKGSQELQAEFKTRQTTPVLLFNFEMLRHVAELYTLEIFKMFQDEYVKFVDCTIYKASKSDSIIKYRVKYRNKTQEHLVKYEASTTTVQCSCMKFSFLGILCSHALKVLDKKNLSLFATVAANMFRGNPCPNNYYKAYGFDNGLFNILRFFESHEAQRDINKVLGLIFILGLDMLINGLLQKGIKDFTVFMCCVSPVFATRYLLKFHQRPTVPSRKKSKATVKWRHSGANELKTNFDGSRVYGNQ